MKEAKLQDPGVSGIDHSIAAWLAWSLCAISLVLTALGLWLLNLNLANPGTPVYEPWLDNTLGALSYAPVGALVASRRPANPVGWLVCLYGFVIALSYFCAEYAIYALLAEPGSLTATLVAVYFGSVATMQAFFRAITGQEQQPQLAVVVSTLAIAALFDPVRRRIQSFIDRRFYRQKYDAAKSLEAYSARLRDETDLGSLSEELIGAVKETMQPEYVSLWLRAGTALGDRRVRRQQ